MNVNENDKSKPDFSVDGEAEELAVAAGTAPAPKAEGEGIAAGVADAATGESDEAKEDAGAAAAAVAAPTAVAGEAAPAAADKGNAIPPERFQRVNDKLAATLAENERLRAELQAKALAAGAPAATAATTEPAVDLKALRQARRDALYAGDDDKADGIEEKIEAELERRAEERAYNRIHAETTRNALDAKAAELTEKYTFLDPASNDANQDAIDEVVVLRDSYIAKGKPAHVALELAVNKIAKIYSAEAAAPAVAGGAAPAPVDLSKARQTAALQRAGAASTTQPAPLAAGVGARSGTAVINERNLTDEQVKALDKKEMFG